MDEIAQEKTVYIGFWGSVVLKGLLSLAEVVASVIVFAVPTAFLTDSATTLIHSGLLGSEHSFLATQLLKVVQEFTRGTQIFVALYLFTRGTIKLVLITALLKNKLWAYPWSLGVLGALVLFQVYQIATTHSLIVVSITLFDLVVMYFIWQEYKLVKAHHGQRKEFFLEDAHSVTGTE